MYLCVYLPYLCILIESILNNYINKCLGGKVYPKHNLSMAFSERTLLINLTSKSFFPIPKICHNKFDPVLDPSEYIMLGNEGIKFYRIIPGSGDPVHLHTKVHLNQEVDDDLYSSVGGMQLGNVVREVLCHIVSDLRSIQTSKPIYHFASQVLHMLLTLVSHYNLGEMLK